MLALHVFIMWGWGKRTNLHYYYYYPCYHLYAVYMYVPETNHVSRMYCVAAILYLHFVLHVMLFRLWNMFCTFTLVFSVACVLCAMLLFFSPPLPGMLLRYCLSDFEIVPVAPLITGITFAFTIHMGWICILRSLYFKIFSASFFITFPSPGFATSINMHVPFLLSRIMMSGLFLGVVLSW